MELPVRGIWQRLKLVCIAVAAMTLGITWTWQGATTQAGIYSVRLLPSVIQANVGGSFTVDLKANMVIDSAATGRVSGSVTYPADLVQLQSVVNGDYPEVSITSGAGLITVASPDKGSGNGYGGQKVLFTATFTAIAGGTANFAATNGVMVVNGTNHVVVAGSVQTIGCQPGYTGTYPNCIAPPAPSPPSTPATSPPATTTTGTSAVTPQATTPAAATTKPSATQQQAAAIAPQTSGTSTVAITEQSHESTPTSIRATLQATEMLHDIQLRYGTSLDGLGMTSAPTQEDNTLDFEVQGLEPSTVYYFKLTALDTNNKDLAYQTGYQTKGYPVKITLAGAGLKLAGRQLTIDDTSFTSDAAGNIIAYLPPNDYTVTDIESGRTVTITVIRAAVPAGQQPTVQEFTMQLFAKKQRAEPWVLTVTGIAVIALTASSIFFFRRHHSKHVHGMGHGLWETQPYVPIEKPKEHFMAPASATPQSIVLPDTPVTSQETDDDIEENVEDDSDMLWNRKTLPTIEADHASPYIDSNVPALGVHTKDHRPRTNLLHDQPKIKGVRSRAESKPESEGIDPDED